MTLLVPPRSAAPRRSLQLDLSQCLIVQRLSPGTASGTGSESQPCSGCGGDVWLSAGGRRLVAANPGLSVVCVECAGACLKRTRPRGTAR